jgi:predicted nucleic acid-binding protein
VVVDASALAAVAFEEPATEVVAPRLHRAVVHAPSLLKFELANVARKKLRARDARPGAIVAALRNALDPRRGIIWHDVDHADVVLITGKTGLSAYDASYVWLAGILGADLVTLDDRLMRAIEPLSV